jgi:hypothetical protein
MPGAACGLKFTAGPVATKPSAGAPPISGFLDLMAAGHIAPEMWTRVHPRSPASSTSWGRSLMPGHSAADDAQKNKRQNNGDVYKSPRHECPTMRVCKIRNTDPTIAVDNLIYVFAKRIEVISRNLSVGLGLERSLHVCFCNAVVLFIRE